MQSSAYPKVPLLSAAFEESKNTWQRRLWLRVYDNDGDGDGDVEDGDDDDDDADDYDDYDYDDVRPNRVVIVFGAVHKWRYALWWVKHLWRWRDEGFQKYGVT